MEKSEETVVWDLLKMLFQNFVVDVQSTVSLVVIKTLPGNAACVDSQIDHLKQDSVLGTVAGDDTILLPKIMGRIYFLLNDPHFF